MEKCICVKEDKISELENRLRDIELEDIKQTKDLERFQESLDRLNDTLDELRLIIEKLQEKPGRKYEQIEMIIISGILGGIITLLFTTLGG